MFVKFLNAWRGYAAGQIAECKTSAEIAGIQPQIDAGVCCEYDPDAPEDDPAVKPKRKRRPKKELAEDENADEPAPKSAMTMGNMFGGDKT